MLDQHGNSVTLPPGHTSDMYAGTMGFLYVPLTLLDNRETTDRESPSDLYSRLKASDDSCVSFRHRQYDWHRTRVLAAFAELETEELRQRSYASCGAHAWLMQSVSDRSRFSLRSSTCHDRWCPACAKTRARVIQTNIAPLVEGKQLRFITLTLKHNDDGLSDRLDRLHFCFRLLRKLAIWKNAVAGGAAFIEVKINKETRRWHPHIHILCVGDYIPAQKLRAAWLACTGDSHVVDIRIVKDPRKIANYVTKYVTKPADNDLYRDAKALQEAIVAMKGRRLVATYGSWRATALLKYEPQDEWSPVLEWPEFIRRIHQGNTWCINAMTCLTKYDFDSNDPNPPNDALIHDWVP